MQRKLQSFHKQQSSEYISDLSTYDIKTNKNLKHLAKLATEITTTNTVIHLAK